MQALLSDFRSEFLESLLDVLWRQWIRVGVSGHGAEWENSVIDPEALLLFSCTVGRYDARLFDAAAEWVQANSRFVNVQRVKRMLKEESFAGESVLRAVAAAAETSVHEAKWERIKGGDSTTQSEGESLFLFKDGRPHPVVGEEDPVYSGFGFRRTRFEPRGAAQSFRPGPTSNLLLKLRALFGVNARCEIMLFLLLNTQGSPRSMGRDCYYFPATVSKALAEMSRSGYVVSRLEGRHRYYRLVPETWATLLLGETARPPWIVWARLFSALEQVWLFLNREDLAGESALVQSSLLRSMLEESVLSRLQRSGPGLALGDVLGQLGETLIPFFIQRMRLVLAGLRRLGGS